MSSGLRHVVKRSVHKERHQPAARQKLGILEKKKDFQKRAKHLHKKKDIIDTLKHKAFLRNPDEFAFGMIHAKTNSAGQIELPHSQKENPLAVKAREEKETRQCMRELRTDSKGVVHKFRFERKK